METLWTELTDGTAKDQSFDDVVRLLVRTSGAPPVGSGTRTSGQTETTLESGGAKGPSEQLRATSQQGIQLEYRQVWRVLGRREIPSTAKLSADDVALFQTTAKRAIADWKELVHRTRGGSAHCTKHPRSQAAVGPTKPSRKPSSVKPSQAKQ